jgi:hypothetical protein
VSGFPGLTGTPAQARRRSWETRAGAARTAAPAFATAPRATNGSNKPLGDVADPPSEKPIVFRSADATTLAGEDCLFKRGVVESGCCSPSGCPSEV